MALLQLYTLSAQYSVFVSTLFCSCRALTAQRPSSWAIISPCFLLLLPPCFPSYSLFSLLFYYPTCQGKSPFLPSHTSQSDYRKSYWLSPSKPGLDLPTSPCFSCCRLGLSYPHHPHQHLFSTWQPEPCFNVSLVISLFCSKLPLYLMTEVIVYYRNPPWLCHLVPCNPLASSVTQFISL